MLPLSVSENDFPIYLFHAPVSCRRFRPDIFVKYITIKKRKKPPRHLFFYVSEMSRGSVLSKENVYFLFYILQCIRIFFTGADFYDSVNIVYKDLAIADMSGIQNFLCSFDDLIDRNAADYHFYFYFWKQGCINFNTTVFLCASDAAL